jgi:hypothetical protein
MNGGISKFLVYFYPLVESANFENVVINLDEKDKFNKFEMKNKISKSPLSKLISSFKHSSFLEESEEYSWKFYFLRNYSKNFYLFSSISFLFSRRLYLLSVIYSSFSSDSSSSSPLLLLISIMNLCLHPRSSLSALGFLSLRILSSFVFNKPPNPLKISPFLFFFFALKSLSSSFSHVRRFFDPFMCSNSLF